MFLTIYFNGQFWCGLIEYYDEKNRWIVQEYIFGPEPKNQEVMDFVHHVLPTILSEEWLVSANEQQPKERCFKKINPKRQHRLINKAKKKHVIGTKSQQAIQLQLEEKKKLSKSVRKKRHEQIEKEKFKKKQVKKHQKHRGH